MIFKENCPILDLSLCLIVERPSIFFLVFQYISVMMDHDVLNDHFDHYRFCSIPSALESISFSSIGYDLKSRTKFYLYDDIWIFWNLIVINPNRLTQFLILTSDK